MSATTTEIGIILKFVTFYGLMNTVLKNTYFVVDHALTYKCFSSRLQIRLLRRIS